MKILLKKYVSKLTGIVLIIFYSGCSSLDIAPISEISSSSFWKTEADVSGAVNGMYARFRSLATVSGQGASDLFIFGEARSEVMGYSTANAGGFANYFMNQMSLDFAGPSWISWYRLIHDTNLLIKYIPRIQFVSEDIRDNYLAQAFAMRAFCYFVLVKTWGDVPLRLEPLESVDPKGIHVPRAAKSSVFEIIKKDIDKALSLFQNNSFSAGRSIWSKPAVNVLKADVYLWAAKVESGGTSDLETALVALNDVDAADVGLLDDFGNIFRYANKGNREVVLAVRLLEEESGSNWSDFQNSWIMSYPTNTSQETMDFVGSVGGTEMWTASSTIRAQFSEEDQRKDQTYFDIYNGSTLYSTVITKFRGIVSGGTRKFIDDVVIYRYADVLLMKAEAKNALGQDPSNEINQVRQRAYGDNYAGHVFVNGTREQNDEAILKERLLELVFEGKRWWDLIRFGKAFELVPSLKGRESESHLLLFPVSRAVLTSEPQVTPTAGY